MMHLTEPAKDLGQWAFVRGHDLNTVQGVDSFTADLSDNRPHAAEWLWDCSPDEWLEVIQGATEEFNRLAAMLA